MKFLLYYARIDVYNLQ